MFLGQSIHTLDPKSRVFVPKRFQEVLLAAQDGAQPAVAEGGKPKGARAILTRGTERCIFLYTEAGFREAIEKMNLGAFHDAQLRTVQRLFFANIEKVRLDGSGRVLLPEPLRTFAGLDKEVAMVGVADRAEIWSREAWEGFNTDHAADFDGLAARLAGGQEQGGRVDP